MQDALGTRQLRDSLQMLLLALGNILRRVGEIKSIKLNEELTFFIPAFNFLFSTFNLYGYLPLSGIHLWAKASKILVKHSALIVML